MTNTSARQVHPTADLFPMLNDDELLALADDIKANGLRMPIVLDPDGRVLDGRNRLAACELGKVEPMFVTYDGDADSFVISANVHRRHLSLDQQAMATAVLLAQQGKRRKGRWVRGSVPPGTPESGSKRWANVMASAGLVLDHAPDSAKEIIAGTTRIDWVLGGVVDERKRQKRILGLAHDDEELAGRISAAWERACSDGYRIEVDGIARDLEYWELSPAERRGVNEQRYEKAAADTEARVEAFIEGLGDQQRDEQAAAAAAMERRAVDRERARQALIARGEQGGDALDPTVELARFEAAIDDAVRNARDAFSRLAIASALENAELVERISKVLRSERGLDDEIIGAIWTVVGVPIGEHGETP